MAVNLANVTQCRITAHQNAQKEPVRTVVPYVFALPYITIHPEYCWVVADEQDIAVGYIVAVPDSAKYLQRVKEEYLPLFQEQHLADLADRNPGLWISSIGDGTTSPDASMSPGNEIERVGKAGGPEEVAEALVKRFWNPDESILHTKWPMLLKEYPCHIHIDILPGYTGQKLGTRLMKELLAKLKEDKVSGIHLMKSGDNEASEWFYKSVGFQRYQVFMGGSATVKGVKEGGGVCMVTKVDDAIEFLKNKK